MDSLQLNEGPRRSVPSLTTYGDLDCAWPKPHGAGTNLSQRREVYERQIFLIFRLSTSLGCCGATLRDAVATYSCT